MRSDVSITGFSIGTFITVSNPDAIPFYELPKRPIGEAIPSSTIHEFSAFSAGRPRSRRFRPRRRDFRSRENCAPVLREDRRRGTEAEAKPLHDDVSDIGFWQRNLTSLLTGAYGLTGFGLFVLAKKM